MRVNIGSPPRRGRRGVGGGAGEHVGEGGEGLEEKDIEGYARLSTKEKEVYEEIQEKYTEEFYIRLTEESRKKKDTAKRSAESVLGNGDGVFGP